LTHIALLLHTIFITEKVKVKNYKSYTIVLTLFSLLVAFILFSPHSYAQTQAKKKKTTHSKYYKTSQLDVNEVKAYIEAIGIKEPDIVLRQAVYETGEFKYRPLMLKHNLFGFRQHKHYLYYKSWRACIDYYKKWQDKNYTDDTEDYYNFLIRIKYATSPVYIAHLKSVKLNLKR
jgi:hypothetical protein